MYYIILAFKSSTNYDDVHEIVFVLLMNAVNINIICILNVLEHQI